MLLNLFCFVGVARWYENSFPRDNNSKEGTGEGTGAKLEMTPIV